MLTEKLSQVEVQQVREQLERILAEPSFRASKRSSSFLTFVVDETLSGSEQIKERTIGVAVFGREPAYDTAIDHVVRTAATELRKRLALYYSDSRRSNQLVISLPPGSYIPHFTPSHSELIVGVEPIESAGKGHDISPSADAVLVHNEESKDSQAASSIEKTQAWRMWRRWRRSLFAALFCILLTAGWIASGRKAEQTPNELDRFLGPTSEKVLACVGAPSLRENQPPPEFATKPDNLGIPAENNVLIPFSDAQAIMIASGVAESSGRAFHVELARNCNFSDLRTGPNILVGALDNPWTLRLTQETPFRFEGSDSKVGKLLQDGSPLRLLGEVNFEIPYFDRTQDFGILALYRSETFNKPTIIMAGIGPNGTLAAAELFSDKSRLEGLLKSARGREGKANVAFAFATQVIEGRSGKPKILATQTW